MSDDPLSRLAVVASVALGGVAGVKASHTAPDAQVAGRTAAWLTAATDASSPDTQLFARLIAARDVRNELALLGLEQPGWDALMKRRFVHAGARALAPAIAIAIGEHAEFVHTLHALLLTHASAAVDADDAHCLASIIAHACLRPDHLWRDLGLAGRDEVTWMLTRYFPTLVVLNVANLRWKKFLAQQRALSLGLQPGPAPGCPGCQDYGHCFPERR